ncbi:hypothetical protein JCM8547_003549 [Rhodosporidiobolus lusitaniae]
MSKLLYGDTRPWPAFEAVNDSIRGGKSTSSWTVGAGNVARFSGHLDIIALGGAGFASQSTTFTPRLSLNPRGSPGLHLTFIPPTLPLTSEKNTLSLLPPYEPYRYVLLLKNDKPERREDGRRESVVVYEWELNVKEFEEVRVGGKRGDGRKKEEDEEKLLSGKEKEAVTVLARWGKFKPHYRGKEKPDAEPLDPSSIYELSFMCRSNFGDQAGDFSLDIVSLAEAPKEGKLDKAKSWVLLALQLLRQWKEWLAGLFGRGKVGGVKL